MFPIHVHYICVHCIPFLSADFSTFSAFFYCACVGLLTLHLYRVGEVLEHTVRERPILLTGCRTVSIESIYLQGEGSFLLGFNALVGRLTRNTGTPSDEARICGYPSHWISLR